MVVSGAERLTAECLRRTRHTQEDSIDESKEDALDKGESGEFGFTNMSDEGLSDDDEAEGRYS